MIGALSLDQLRIFVAICDHGGFAAAGRALGRVQSAISQSVRTLEEVQQVKLFERSGRNMRLTAAGRVLLEQARQVLRQAMVFEQIAVSVAMGLEPELKLVVDCFVPVLPVMEGVRQVGARYPDLPITLFTEGPWAGQRRIRDGSAALAIGAAFPTIEQDMRAYPLFAINLVPVAGSTHPLARQNGEITRDHLQQHTQLVLTDPHDASGPSYGVVSPNIWRFVDMTRRIEFLEAGFGWANIPDHLAARGIQAGRLKELAVIDPATRVRAMAIYAFHDRMKPLGSAAKLFLDELQARFAVAGA